MGSVFYFFTVMDEGFLFFFLKIIFTNVAPVDNRGFNGQTSHVCSMSTIVQ